MMYCHCGTNNRAPRWTFTDPCKPDMRPGAREESASPAWLAAPVMNARNTTKTLFGRFNIYTPKELVRWFSIEAKRKELNCVINEDIAYDMTM